MGVMSNDEPKSKPAPTVEERAASATCILCLDTGTQTGRHLGCAGVGCGACGYTGTMSSRCNSCK